MNPYQLKPAKEIDYADLYNLVNKDRDQLIRYFPITMGSTGSLKKTKAYVESLSTKFKNKEMFCFGVYENTNVIGLVYLKSIDWRIPKCEVGYFLGSDYFGKGIMSTILPQTISYCFDTLKMNKIFARISPKNEASKNLILKNGFELEGVLKKEFKIETGEIVDINYYGLVNPNFRQEIL